MSMLNSATYATVMVKSRKEARGHCRGQADAVATGFLAYVTTEAGKAAPVLITAREAVADYADIRLEAVSGQEGDPVEALKPVELVTDRDGWLLSDERVGLACIPIKKIFSPAKITPILNIFDHDLIASEGELAAIHLTERVISIGFDAREDMGARVYRPTLRIGLTATDPGIKHRGREEFLVGMDCFPGSAGSPIVIYREASVSGADGKEVADEPFMRVIGVLRPSPSLPTAETPIDERSPVFTCPPEMGIAVKITEVGRAFREALSSFGEFMASV